jgi:hypothetical protein
VLGDGGANELLKRPPQQQQFSRQQVYLIPQQQHFYDNKFTSFSCQEKIPKKIKIKKPMKLFAYKPFGTLFTHNF